MRSYGTEPQLWGGDGSCGDEHEWADGTLDRSGTARPQNYFNGQGWQGERGGAASARRSGGATETTHALCRRCHAWRGELGQEPAVDCGGYMRGEPPEACTQGCFIDHLRLVMAGLRRVLRDDGLAFIELADSYAGSGMTGGSGKETITGGTRVQQEKMFHSGPRASGIPAKSLLLVPERFRLAMLSDGWVVRSVVRWNKRAPMPESCRDRFTSAVSEVVMLSKGSRYFSDFEAVRERANKEGQLNRASGSAAKNNGTGNPTAIGFTKHDSIVTGRNPRNYAFLDPDDEGGAFRQATSEVVMLSKGATYYSDMQAVAERTSETTHGWTPKEIAPDDDKAWNTGNGHSGRRHATSASGRNPRNYAFLDDPGLSDEDFAALVDAVDEALAAYAADPRPPDWVHLSPEPSKLSHYASFGPKAIAPFLKLATSERGCCSNPECGAAWERVTERDAPAVGKRTFASTEAGWIPTKGGNPNQGGYLKPRGAETTGWRPRCTCGLPESSNVPCRTLDCFGGSGTVGVVSEKLGLDCTLIDLSPDYVGMAALRLQLEGAPLFAQNGHAHDDRAGGLEQLSLMDGVR